MKAQILDETPAACAAAWKTTLREMLALTPDLFKGVKFIVLRPKGDYGSEYFPQREGSAIINLYLNNLDNHRWRLIPLAWRPWPRARRLAFILSHALARHIHRGKPCNDDRLRREAKQIEADIMRRWVPAWLNNLGLWPWMKPIMKELFRKRLDRIYPSEGSST